MKTICHKQLIFESIFHKEVIADFAGGRIASDAGGLLFRELDRRYRLTDKAARCLHDPRIPTKSLWSFWKRLPGYLKIIDKVRVAC
jgi:hypothetical protein